MARPKRKLLKGEHRVTYKSGRTAIYKYKTDRWKQNKTYNHSTRSWENYDTPREKYKEPKKVLNPLVRVWARLNYEDTDKKLQIEAYAEKSLKGQSEENLKEELKDELWSLIADAFSPEVSQMLTYGVERTEPTFNYISKNYVIKYRRTGGQEWRSL